MFTDKAKAVISMAKDRAYTLGNVNVDIECLLAVIGKKNETRVRLAECIANGDVKKLQEFYPKYNDVQHCLSVMQPDIGLKGILDRAFELAGALGVPDGQHPGFVSLEHLICATAMSNEAVKLLSEGINPMTLKEALVFLTKWSLDKNGGFSLGALTGQLRELRSELLSKVFGQDHAVHAFIEGLYSAQVTAASDLSRKRPMGVFVFAGPPGVGKTYMSELCSTYLKRPFKQFDMTGYSDHQAQNELIGFAPSYKGAKPGILTEFVKENPDAILLFDEIEKAHLTTMQLFYQILDAGRLQDKFDDEDVSFRDTIIIFTTNAGRSLYDNPNKSGIAAANSTYHKRTLLNALENEKNPADGKPAFPPAICSRLGQGYPLMFNHLGVYELERIVEAEMIRTETLLERQYFKSLKHDSMLPISLVLREGANIDARQLRSEAERFIKTELFKFCNMYENERIEDVLEDVNEIVFDIDIESIKKDEAIYKVFYQTDKPNVLLAAGSEFVKKCQSEIPEINWIGVSSAEEIPELLAVHDIDLVLLDLWLQPPNLFSVTDSIRFLEESDKSNTISAGMDHVPLTARALDMGRNILHLIHERFVQIPVYIISFKTSNEFIFDENEMTVCMDAQYDKQEDKKGANINNKRIDDELFLACVRSGGARGLISTEYGVYPANEEVKNSFLQSILTIQSRLFREQQARHLSKERKSLDFQTVSRINYENRVLSITMRDFEFRQIIEASDAGKIISDIDRPSVRLKDVYGATSAKKALEFIVNWLKDPKKYNALGLHPPKGVLMSGPPGTGKTFLARAVAGDSDCAFIETSATSFVTQWQGSGPQNIRDLFERARRYAPSIVFIDEIDAIGKAREGGPSSRAGEETLNALLTEMDGFGATSSSPVIVLAATNLADKLDDALKRRFDRIIEVDKPDKSARFSYLKQTFVKRKQATVSENLLERIASQSTGMTIAELERVVQEAGVMAAQQGKVIDDLLLNESFEKMRMGEANELPNAETLLRIARHEAGHTFIAWQGSNRPYQVTIVGRGGAGGYMERKQDEDKMLYTKPELEQLIREAMGGRAAELIYYNNNDGLSTGVSGDLRQATHRAVLMVRNYGMNEDIGQIALEELMSRDGAIPFAEKTAIEVEKIVSEQLNLAKDLIKHNKVTFDHLVEELIVKNRLSEIELSEILGD